MYKHTAEYNLKRLEGNSYPGRGIVIGKTPDGASMVQIYWIMGRSENSRNRVFINEGGFVRTKAFDESKVTDPSLIIYYPVKHHNPFHIVSNGDQTDTVYEYVKACKTFEEALNTRTFEPDAPNFTPRISGIVETNGRFAYELSILKSQDGNADYCIRSYYKYEKPICGFGHCIHTYNGDGNPLPSFCGEPYLLPVKDNIDETLKIYWSILDLKNRVSLLVKYIDPKSNKITMRIINKHG